MGRGWIKLGREGLGRRGTRLTFALVLIMTIFASMLVSMLQAPVAVAQVYTPVTSENVYEGGTTGISGAQSDDGTYENIYEDNYPYIAEQNVYVQAADKVADNGTITSPENQQADDGNYSKLAEQQILDAIRIFYETFPNLDTSWTGDGNGDTLQNESGWYTRTDSGGAVCTMVQAQDTDAGTLPPSGGNCLEFDDADGGFTDPYGMAYFWRDLSKYDNVKVEWYWQQDATDSGEGHRVHWSPDTTNGYDGTWYLLEEKLNPTEDTWYFSEYYLPSTALVSGFCLRFRAQANGSGEEVFFDDVAIRVARYPLRVRENIVGIPTGYENYYLEIEYYVENNLKDNFRVYVENSTGSLNYRGSLTSGGTALWSYQLLSSELLDGGENIRIQIWDENENSTEANSLYIDFVRVRGRGEFPAYRENVQHNITGIPAADNYALQVEYYLAGDSEPVSVYLYNFSTTNWVNVGNLTSTTLDNFTYDLTGTNYISGGEVRARYVQPDNDSTRTSMMIDYTRVRGITYAWRLIESWTGTVSAPVAWRLIESWTGTVNAPAAWQLVESWTGTIAAPAAWQLVETWTGTVAAPAMWQVVETWTGIVSAPAEWNLIETWTGTVTAPAPAWYLIKTWTGTVQAPAEWQIIETWTGTIEAPAAWQLIETWAGTVSAPAEWQTIETWTGTVSAPAEWQVIETWVGTVNALAAWQLIETWIGTVSAPAQWNFIETWTGTISAPAGWQTIETWSGTISAPAQWSLIETWTGTVSAPAAWQLVENWTGTVSAPAAWQLIETWMGTVEAPVAWQMIEIWIGTVNAPAAWQPIETWTGTISAPAQWNPIETWTGTLSAPAAWQLMETWTGTVNAPAAWRVIETWTGTIQAPVQWQVIETWTGTVQAPAEWQVVETWTGTVTASAEWQFIETWTGTVTAPAQWQTIETWTGTIQAPAEWQVIETWAGTVQAPVQWQAIETWVGTVEAPAAWSLVESWAGTFSAPSEWQVIETWIGTVSAPIEWRLIESWTGTISAPAAWQMIESWTGTVQAPVAWQLIETWTGTVNAPATWQEIETWTGTVNAPPPQWYEIEIWTGIVQAPMAAWQEIETWSGVVTAPMMAWQQIETWTGTVNALAPQWYEIETWTGTVSAPAVWQLVETWTGAVNAPTAWQIIETWTGMVSAPAQWYELETWTGIVQAPAQWYGIETWTGTVTALPPQWCEVETWTGTVSAPVAAWRVIETWIGVIEAPVPDFSISVSPTSGTIQRGSWTSATVTVTSINGYNLTVSLGASGQPLGVTVDFSPSSGAPTFTSAMTMNVGSNAPTGDHVITITGKGTDNKVRTCAYALTITAVAPPPVDTTPPAAPSLISPTDGAKLRDSTPLFDWSDVSDPSGVVYEFEVDDNADFPSPELIKTGLGASQYELLAAEALPDGTYYWRVRAEDGAGNVGEWSTVWTLILDTIPPAAPIIEDLPARTDVQMLVVEGLAEANSVVKVYIGENLVGEAIAEADNRFSITITLAEGPNVLRFVAVDAAGNVSLLTIQTVEYTRAPPPLPFAPTPWVVYAIFAGTIIASGVAVAWVRNRKVKFRSGVRSHGIKPRNRVKSRRRR